jgi:hypothetical protein
MKDLKYYKDNCEEDYLHTPISVLRYITELEKRTETKPLIIDSVVLSSSNICTDTNEECKHNCSGLCKERC